MNSPRRIFLDNAATSFPKPSAVYEAMDRYHRSVGVAAGRGSSSAAMELQGAIDRCRRLAAQLLGATGSDRIVFTFNCTDGLNMALHGLLNPGDHVITSVLEHNSVHRPLGEITARIGTEVTSVPADASGRVDPDSFRRAVRDNTRLMVLTHASNVTGTLQPIEDVGQIARENGALFLLDAAQTAGHVPICLAQLPVDIAACAGHKGLLGPLGTGLLYLREGTEQEVRSFRQGGTGTHSEQRTQPQTMPDKYEAGNLNAGGLSGLEAALTYLEERGIEDIGEHIRTRTREFVEGCRDIAGLKLFGSTDPSLQAGVISFRLTGYDPHDLAAALDDSFGIQTRAGLHCAPGAHQAIGTIDDGGTVRVSPGAFTTPDEITACIDALSQLAA